MRFWDEVEIKFRAGNGGDGAVSFRREKFISKGGPDGGDGGRGGSIKVVASSDEMTLADIAKKHKYQAEHGEAGQGSKKHGKSGEDLVLKVPMGTLVIDRESGQLLADLEEEGKEIAIVKGGEGGLGNSHFARSSYQVPRFAESGTKGEEKHVILRLKLVADVGLVGLPNAGKSTLLSRTTSARPKVADYPFTTLVPGLGVIAKNDARFLMVDVPGLIEGAHEGKGLGIEFLRHVERTRLLLHMVDGMSATWQEDIKVIDKELQSYAPALAARPKFLVINKIDAMTEELRADIHQALKKHAYPVYFISAVSGEGVEALLDAVLQYLQDNPRVIEKVKRTITIEDVDDDKYEVVKADKYFEVIGGKVERYAVKMDLDNEEAFVRFYKVLQRMGVWSELKRKGAKPGDIVKIGKKKIEYRKLT